MKLCMGCMTNIEDNCTTCPHCGYDETTLRQESYYLDPGTVVGGKYIVGRVIRYVDIRLPIWEWMLSTTGKCL